MYQINTTRQFRKSLKTFRGSKKVLSEFEKVVSMLQKDDLLSKKYKDHELKGELRGLRELHIFPDILLIYKKEEKQLILILIDIGSHAKLF